MNRKMCITRIVPYKLPANSVVSCSGAERDKEKRLQLKSIFMLHDYTN